MVEDAVGRQPKFRWKPVVRGPLLLSGVRWLPLPRSRSTERVHQALRMPLTHGIGHPLCCTKALPAAACAAACIVRGRRPCRCQAVTTHDRASGAPPPLLLLLLLLHQLLLLKLLVWELLVVGGRPCRPRRATALQRRPQTWQRALSAGLHALLQHRRLLRAAR